MNVPTMLSARSRACPALLLLTVLAVSLTSGCGGIQGNGVSKTESRDVDGFEKISVSGIVNATVDIGPAHSVEVTADENLIDVVETVVKDGELVIRTRQSVSTGIGIKVHVTMPAIVAAETSGVSKMELNGVGSDALTLDASGTSSIKARGTVRELVVSASGTADAELGDLKAEIVKVSTSGVADATVYASKSVDASASGSSDIEVMGSPADVKKDASGVADIELK